MKKLKFLLPVLAIIFAVGMSFTSVNATADAVGYISLNGSPYEVETNPCVGTGYECKIMVQSLPNPGPYTLYSDFGLEHPYESSTTVPIVIWK